MTRARGEFQAYYITLPAILVLLCAGVGFAGYRYYAGQKRNIESDIQNHISAIADLKVQQIEAWLQERKADADFFSNVPYLGMKPSPTVDTQLHTILQACSKLTRYSDVIAFDASGKLRTRISTEAGLSGHTAVPSMETLRKSPGPIVSDLYTGDGARTYLDFIAASPVREELPGGIILLRRDATEFLSKIVETWPAESRTGEAVLVRREGDHVLFVSGLKGRPGSPMSMAMPITAQVPAAMAARGIEGIHYGSDCRGVQVLAAMRQVKGTPWALVAKLDADEVYAPLRERSITIALAMALLLGGCLTVFGVLWHLHQSRSRQRAYLMELERSNLADRYLQLSRYVNDIVLLLDDRGAVLEANDRAVETYGYTLEELLQLSIRDLLDSSQLVSFDERWTFLEKHSSEVFEGCHRRKDGTPIPVEISSRQFVVDGKRFKQSVIRDITERKRHDEELRRVTRAIQVLSASNQAVVRAGDEIALFRDICDAITGTGGYPLAWIGFAEHDARKSVQLMATSGPGDEYAKNIGVVWADEPLGRGPVGIAIRTGQVTVWNNLDSYADFEPWRESAKRFCYRSIAALPLNSEGEVIGALCIYAEETDAFHPQEMRLLQELAGDLSYGIEARRRYQEQLKAEAALRRSEEEFRTLFDNANDSIFIRDLEGKILEANQAACRNLGYTHEELLSKTIMDLHPPSQAEWGRSRMAHVEQHGTALFETVHKRKDGSDAPMEVNSRLIDYRGKLAVISVSRDMSERKRAQADAEAHAAELERAKTEAETANRAKSQFLANVSHEIRTPMNGIVGMTSLLLDTPLNADQRDFAETVRKSADALLSIVNDILDFSKIEAGKTKITPVDFDVIECLTETGELLAPQAKARDIEYVFEPQVADRWLFGDAGRVRQIVLNLLSNAMKFTEHGRVTLRISQVGVEEGVPVFEISVADTGIGIAPDYLPFLFDKFSQVDSSMGKRHSGTGLGLAISKHLAELMHGQLSVASEVGKGTTFTLRLPMPQAQSAHLAANAHPPNLPSNPVPEEPHQRRILLAEDNKINQKIATLMLKKLGYQVDVAVNGREAVEMAVRFTYDLILMDCGMPEMDGYEATREIRAQQTKTGRIPIVALTAHAVEGAREQCLDAGMDDFITKPVSPATLQKTLELWQGA